MPAAPAFWAKPPGLGAVMLRPAAAVWDGFGRLRQALTHPYRAPVPVVCVGNIVAGGAGKTPVTLALADWLKAHGRPPHIVTRGHGGRLGGPIRVDLDRHDAAAVGDEALLLAERAPCWVSRDRADGVRAAVAAGAALILLDDGFQNPEIVKDLSLLVVDAGYGFGNRRVIPAGPLREDLDRGLARADALVVVKTPGEAAQCPEVVAACRLPTIPAVVRPIAGERFAGARLYAFAGIGRPQKFFATLRGLGACLVGTAPFPDHHRFRSAGLDSLRRAADNANARLVTTAKDIVRIIPEMRAGIEVLSIDILWPEPAALERMFAPALRLAEFRAPLSTPNRG
jgi:tetraacyldisaccharide 4'-kinase